MDIHEILAQEDKSLVDVYFELQTLLEQRYGNNTVVVIEVGSFFEVYGVDNKEMSLGKPKEIAEILNLQLTRRNKHIAENSLKNPLLCGFPTATFDRYISRLVQEKKYTIAIVRQKGEPPAVTRYVDRILSPGVNFDYTVDHDETLIASITVDEQQGVFTIGYAAIDVTTGICYTLHASGSKEDKTAALDELFSVVHSHRTTEILITTLNPRVSKQELLEYLEIQQQHKVHHTTSRPPIAYQNELFKQTFAIESFLSPIEYLNLEHTPLTGEALAVLIEFIIDHEYSIMKKLRMPVSIEPRRFLYLGNNPLEQLNIISRDPNERVLLDVIDYTKTSLGRRLLKDRLLHPIVDKQQIEQRYHLAEAVRPFLGDIEQALTNVYDMERLLRRVQLARLHPFEINFLYDSLVAAKTCITILRTTTTPHAVIVDMQQKEKDIDAAIHYIQHIFLLSDTAGMSLSTIDGTFFQPNTHTPLDDLVQKQHAAYSKLLSIKDHIVSVLEEQTGKKEPEYIHIKQLDKEGHYISMTKSRYALIQDALKKTFISLDGTVYALSDFRYKVQTTNIKITSDSIDRISEELLLLQTKIRAMVKELFVQELHIIDTKFHDIIAHSIQFISAIDVAASTIRSSIALRLQRPEIVDTAPHEHILDIQQLRHPLVELREEQGVYVPNNLVLGNKTYAQQSCVTSDIPSDDIRGVLLYGINSSGKSSLMKSIGIAVILAQAGLYVPAASMRFSLFHELFTRIVGKDNFARGLSSFAVEMMELKHIFARATEKSLLLGDEISHGTETLSSLAIVLSTMMRLSQSGSLFVFTTHLHQLQQLPYMQQLPHVISVHMSVRYDEQEDRLIFDRQLQSGSGSSVYGLEFAQSLHMDEQFLKTAMKIRRELAGELDTVELLTQKQQSPYHTDMYLTVCAVCKKKVQETHHIVPQQQADDHGNIAHIHKNNKANLVALCEACHSQVHQGTLIIRGYIMTSKGLVLDIEKK